MRFGPNLTGHAAADVSGLPPQRVPLSLRMRARPRPHAHRGPGQPLAHNSRVRRHRAQHPRRLQPRGAEHSLQRRCVPIGPIQQVSALLVQEVEGRSARVRGFSARAAGEPARRSAHRAGPRGEFAAWAVEQRAYPIRIGLVAAVAGAASIGGPVSQADRGHGPRASILQRIGVRSSGVRAAAPFSAVLLARRRQ
jgi:hypothetical protein